MASSSHSSLGNNLLWLEIYLFHANILILGAVTEKTELSVLQELLEVTKAKLGFIVSVLLTGPWTQISAKHFHGELNSARSSGCPAMPRQSIRKQLH